MAPTLRVFSILGMRAGNAPTMNMVCGARLALHVLEPMLIELGPGTSAGERDRLASDEPNASLPSPT